jgi:hypothetical protein
MTSQRDQIAALFERQAIDRSFKPRAFFEAIFYMFDRRVSDLEGARNLVEEARQQLIALALSQLTEVVSPVTEAAQDTLAATELGMAALLGGDWMTATSSSGVALAEGLSRTFVIDEDRRAGFIASSWLAIGRQANADLAAIASLTSYDKETGALIITVEQIVDGDTDPHSDWEIGAVAGATLAAISAMDDAVVAQVAAEAAAATATTKATEATTARDTAVASAATATTKAGEASTSADDAAASAAAAAAAASSLANGVFLVGDWDASAGTFPGGGTAQLGALYKVTVAGTVGGIEFGVDDSLIALVDNASTTVYAANWFKVEGGTVTSSQVVAALGFTPVTNARTVSGTGLATGGGDFSANRTIDVAVASQAEAEAGTANDKAMTPLRHKQGVDIRLATQAEAEAGTDATKLITPLRAAQAIAALAATQRSARTANTILGAADKRQLIEFTANTFTQTFTAAATLGSKWWCYLYNSGSGDVTLDPNSSETIDGLATFIMYPGEMRLVTCDGSNFKSVVLKPFLKTFTATAAAGFTKPPGYITFQGIVRGGGASGSRSTTNGGGGGGGGAAHPFVLPASAIGTTEDITVGAAVAGVSTDVAGINGNQSSFGSLVVAKGGGQGLATGSAGGGGGIFTAGAANGGEPVGGGNSSPGGDSNFGGGGGGNTAGGAGGKSIFGGGGGGGGTSGGVAGAGGKSIYGGGAGGGASSGAFGVGGTSLFAGAGGDGSSAGTAVTGTAPSGGGGGTKSGTSGGGARGQVDIWGNV